MVSKSQWPARRRFNKKNYTLTQTSKTKLKKGKTSQNKKFNERNVGPTKRKNPYAKYTRRKNSPFKRTGF
jgi:hypothetical protein